MERTGLGAAGMRRIAAAGALIGFSGAVGAQAPWLWLDRGVGALVEGWFTTNGGAAANVRRDTAGQTLNATIAGMAANDRLYVNAHGAPGYASLQGADHEGFGANAAAGTDPNGAVNHGAPYNIPVQANANVRLVVCNAGTVPPALGWPGGRSVAATGLAALGAGSACTGPAQLQGGGLTLTIAGANRRQRATMTNLCDIWCAITPAINRRHMADWFENTALANHAANIATLNAANGPIDIFNQTFNTNFAIGGVTYVLDPMPAGAPPALVGPDDLCPQQVFFDAGQPTPESYAEIEPNGNKDEFSLPRCILAGDTLTGTSLGSSQATGDGSLASADVWRVTTRTLSGPAIRRQRLSLTGSGHSATLMGLAQSAGTIQIGTDSAYQGSMQTGFVQWYGFGYGEQVYVRVDGAAATSADYSLSLETADVVPIDVATPVGAGSVTLSWIGTTGADTDMWLYDSAFRPIPGAGNDDSGGYQSSLTRTLGEGTYYVAVSDGQLANDQPSPSDDGWQNGDVLDLSESVAGSSAAYPVGLDFTISDGTATVPVVATKSSPFEVVWIRFTVAGGTHVPFCPGDGSGTPCPCGNTGASGHGCANSVNPAGGLLGASGNASISADTLVLSGSDMVSSSVLYFQGTTRLNGGAGMVFGDGLRCAGGSVIRLDIGTNVGGASQYPNPGDAPVSVRGAVSAPGVRTYQCWYRNAGAFCTPSTFNLTNGVEVTWAF